jgi:[protein-PII] uridylyltransferase
VSRSLRDAREDLVARTDLGGLAFGAALAERVDDALVDAAAALDASPAWALVALGSYARRELCPGSDIDVMLLHAGGKRGGPSAEVAGTLWYPLWDAGFVLGQSVRTVKEALAVADDDLDAMTALLDLRLVAGDAALLADLGSKVQRLAPRRRGRLVGELAAAAAERLERPGPIAEMLEPNLKTGAGGLRDLQAPGWAGWALPAAETVPGRPAPTGGWDGGVELLVARGYLQPGDPERLRHARTLLLTARVALHRVTGGTSDQLPLQEQDAVAHLVGSADADALVRSLGAAARSVVWITSDLWARLLAAEAGPKSLGGAARVLGGGVVLRDGRIALDPDTDVDTVVVLRAAGHAARLRVPFERATLARLAALTDVEWDARALDALVELLAAGRGTIAAFEALDHVGVLVRLLPEWEHVRARPQRNAYHRFTVDRHSLEAVSECAALLDPDDPRGAGFDGDAARRARADVLLLAALLHDIGKGRPGDHSVVGADTARAVAARIGLDPAGGELLAWAVRHHLLLADTATRRDLADERTITRFADAVGDSDHNTLLYALTLGDSRATGPAAWNASKAALVRQLFAQTDSVLREGAAPVEPLPERRAELGAQVGETAAAAYLDAMPPAYASAFAPEEMARHRELLAARGRALDWTELPDGRLRCTLVEPDRTGLLATAAAALALVGFDIVTAAAFSHADGMALEVFTGVDRFGRLAGDDERSAAAATISASLDGTTDLDEQLRARTRRYRPADTGTSDRDVRVLVDPEASAHATVVEVHAPDDIGVLARVASVFVDLGLDVAQAIVSTVGDRVVDVFYLRDPSGTRFADRHAVDALRATLFTRLTTVVTLDDHRDADG